jgi:hypothetical protein
MAGSGCKGIEFACDTDSSLGDPDTVFAFESYDTTSPLAADEALIDLTQDFTVETDPITGCVISLWAYILSHLNQSGGGTTYIQIYIRIYQIYINTQFRVKKQ